MNRLSTQAVVEAGLAVALAVILRQIPGIQMPFGGEISWASMVPLLLVALRRGPKVGITAGLVFGLTRFIQDPASYKVHWVQIILDYFIAFGVLGLAGFFPRRPTAGVTVGILGRFVSHVISGVVFFSQWTPENIKAWAGPWGGLTYSVLYNGAYMLPELIISLIMVGIVWRALNRQRGVPTGGEAK
ncbi:MAG: energy-coupled thiamine transporter ThiT [Symbiobacteriia bacterium]